MVQNAPAAPMPLDNTADIAPPAIYCTNPYSAGLSGSLSIPRFSISGGYSYADGGCDRRTIAAMAYSTGQRDLAWDTMCRDPAVREPPS